ncbi:MAG: response regulator [Candidatus Parcubacteria bacterium]|nr:MAG: response regulator [Candidatus Parcubacteria bacterium]
MSSLPFQRVMLVDDDQFLLDMYRTKFQSEGAEVVAYSNTKQALRSLQEGKVQPDVILIDMVMPEMDGVAFLQELRKLPRGSSFTAIMLTNQGQDTDQQAARQAGAEGFLIKANLTPSEVVREVARIVSQKGRHLSRGNGGDK